MTKVSEQMTDVVDDATMLNEALEAQTAAAASGEHLGVSPVSLRDRILRADDIRHENVYIPEWDVTLTLQSMTGKARASMLKMATDPETGEMDFERLYPDLLIASAVDPDTGAYVFTASDRDLLNQKNSKALEAAGKVAMRLSGMGKEAADSLGETSLKESGGSTSN